MGGGAGNLEKGKNQMSPMAAPGFFMGEHPGQNVRGEDPRLAQ